MAFNTDEVHSRHGGTLQATPYLPMLQRLQPVFLVIRDFSPTTASDGTQKNLAFPRKRCLASKGIAVFHTKFLLAITFGVFVYSYSLGELAITVSKKGVGKDEKEGGFENSMVPNGDQERQARECR